MRVFQRSLARQYGNIGYSISSAIFATNIQLPFTIVFLLNFAVATLFCFDKQLNGYLAVATFFIAEMF